MHRWLLLCGAFVLGCDGAAGDPCDGTCGADEVCSDGACLMPCNADGECEETEVCRAGACYASTCGDGALEGAEECDTGEANADNSGCTTACRLNVCGDDLLFVGQEECDDGNTEDNDDCTAACADATCGDGSLHAEDEVCDDGDTAAGDGCSAICGVESGFCCIEGTRCVADQYVNPDNVCLICDAAVNNLGWSAAATCPDVVPCTDGSECYVAEVCECADGLCGARVCSEVTCPCQFNVDGDATCDGNLTPDATAGQEDCQAHDCADGAEGAVYYWGVLDDNDDTVDDPTCFYAAAMAAACEGGDCRSRADACLSAPQGAAVTGRPICTRPSVDACTGVTAPTWDNVVLDDDPYGDCPGLCDGSGGCLAQLGDSCAGGEICATGLQCDGVICCPDGGCIGAPGNPCAGNGDCDSGNCVDDVCCVSSSCGTCERCDITGDGTCAAVTVVDGRNCVDDCSHCVAGSCVVRPVGDFSECSTSCDACTTAGGDCGVYTGAAGAICDDDDTFCCAGNCVNPAASPSEFAAPCGTGDCAGGTWGCSFTAAQCSSFGDDCDYCVGDQVYDAVCSDDLGATCSVGTAGECPTCNICYDGGATASCGPSNAFEQDTTGANTCTGRDTCDGMGTCLKDFGESCGGADECASNFCVDNVCCQSFSCGTCERCDLSGDGTCAGATGDNGVGCTDDCSACVAGSCNVRAAGDFTECAGTCQACTTAGGNCGDWTGQEGTSCNTGSTFCCAGSCVDPPGLTSEFATVCGSGDCSGLWACGGSAYACTSNGSACDSCSGDSQVDGACDADGGCVAGASVECPSCQACVDGGATVSCAPYPFMSEDFVGANVCALALACDCCGACKLAPGEACSSNTECASDDCQGSPGICS